jgi:RES domain-containing protein
VATAWRLTKTRYLESAWDGEGARQKGGRWNSVGTPVVYVSATLSLALTEQLVHVDAGILPAFMAIPVEFDESLVSVLEPKDLPSDWQSHPPPRSTQAIGDKWVSSAESAMLRVPSVVVPVESNYVVNPGHSDFRRLRIGKPVGFPLDSRLLRA